MKRRSSTLSLIKKKNKETKKKNCRILSNVHASLHPGIESTDAHHKLSPIQIESAMFNALDASTLPLNNPSLPSSSRRRNRTSTDVDQPDRGSSSSTYGGGRGGWLEYPSRNRVPRFLWKVLSSHSRHKGSDSPL